MLKDLADSKRLNQRVRTEVEVRCCIFVCLISCSLLTSALSTFQSVIQPKIISRLFWPSFQSSALTLPGQLQAYVPLRLQGYSRTAWLKTSPSSGFSRATAAYADAYHQVKPDKRLRWLPHLGTVDIKLELEDRTVELEVNLLQASVIELFGQQGAAQSTRRKTDVLLLRPTAD